MAGAAAKNRGVGCRTKTKNKAQEVLKEQFLACLLSYPESNEKIDIFFISVRPVKREVQAVFSPA